MEQSGTSALLQGAVQDLATAVVSALRGGDHMRATGTETTDDPARGLALAAVRVLGADALLPHVLLHTTPAPEELAVFRASVAGFPPRADAALTVVWSHWAMTRTLRRFETPLDDPPAHREREEPDAGWLDTCLEACMWDLSCELLAVAASVPGQAASLQDAWHRIASAQHDTGAIPEEGGRDALDPRAADAGDDFAHCYHSTLMAAFAATLNIRHTDGEERDHDNGRMQGVLR
ncbi:DUF6895 family protein [Streptomyces sp. KR55]|uniref:DUF6895 family protein n=1 Tax=Streptomyces sp. KR55 TaxID=3457425 RepID=UPI003FD51D6A